MRRIALTLVALLVLAGCTLPGMGPGQSSAPPSAPPATTQPTASGSASPSQTAMQRPEIASRQISISGIPATVILNEVVVRNGVTSLTWTLRNDQARGTSGLGIQMSGDLFGDGRTATVPGTEQQVPDDIYYVDGIYLLDTANRLRYLPARDAEGRCVCSYAPSSIFIRPGAQQSFDAVFKALPDGVNTIDVVLVRGGTFRGVQVQR